MSHGVWTPDSVELQTLEFRIQRGLELKWGSGVVWIQPLNFSGVWSSGCQRSLKGREVKGREVKGSEGKGREGKGREVK